MNRLPHCLITCLLYLLTPVAHAELDWGFTIETSNFVVNPTDSISVLGRITNFASSTSVLSIFENDYKICPLCLTITPASLLVGVEFDETVSVEVFDVFSIKGGTINDVLPGLSLNPGESFDFTAYTLSPISSSVPLGNYKIHENELRLWTYGFRNAGPVNISVVPEPSTSMLMIIGLGILGLAFRYRKM